MKAVTVERAGAAAEVRADIDTPEPSDAQILVKCIYTAINPVDAFMANMGLLVESWPLVPGCDAAGVVVKTGKNATNPLGGKFEEGDEVFGCTRLGQKGHGAWQEYFLMDAVVAIPKPKNLSFAQACTAGAGILTAFEGIFDAMELPPLDPNNLPEAKNQWVLVFGGASTVGKFAVQTLKLLGYKVVATCSAKSSELLTTIGANATVDYSKDTAELVAEIHRITGDTLKLTFDAVAQNNSIVTTLYTSLPMTDPSRFYVTTNDWDPLPANSLGFRSFAIQLGPIGRLESTKLNARVNNYIPVVYELLESGKIRVGGCTEKGEGIEGILEAWEYLKSGKAGSQKVVVKISER